MEGFGVIGRDWAVMGLGSLPAAGRPQCRAVEHPDNAVVAYRTKYCTLVPVTDCQDHSLAQQTLSS